MNPRRLLQHFDAISEAPDAVAKLRQFILDLAVRGKLVEQLPSETKTIGRSASECGAPFEVPGSWRWAKLGSVCSKTGSGSTPRGGKDAYVTSGVVFLRSQNIYDNGLVLNDVAYISDATHKRMRGTAVQSGDLLLNITGGSIGRCAIAPQDVGNANISQHVAIIRLTPELTSRFGHACVRSPYFQGQVLASQTGAGRGGLPKNRMDEIPVPIPPAEEQRRIVAKVDELMALCDQLQIARDAREQQRDRLVTASLHRLARSGIGHDIDEAITRSECHRFHLEQFARLTTRSEHIKQFRQVILNLAMRGKLVPQRQNEKLPSLPETVYEDLPPGIPATWRYVRLANLLSEDTRNGYSRRPDDAPGGVPILRISAGTVRRDGIVAEEEHKLISGIDAEARRQYGLKSGDLLACRFNGNKAFVGRFSVFNDYLGIRPIYPDKLIRVRVAPDLVLPSFLRLAGDTDMVRSEIENSCATTVGNWGISASNLKQTCFPLPPLAEQHRIVAKVDALMVLCDQLEASLVAAQSDRCRLLDALLHEALQPAAARGGERSHDRWRSRSAISSYVVSRLSPKRSFGRTAHMKHLYLAEAHLGLELDGAYAREAAGPLDVRIYDLEKQATSSGWYSPRVEVLTSGQEKVNYSLGKNIEQIVEEGVSFLGSSRTELDRVLGLMGDMSTEEVEIIATLFAVWNDALIDAESPDDDWIVKEVREHWHKSKQRFTPAELKKWLGWMRANALVPAGKFPRTIQQTTLDF